MKELRELRVGCTFVGVGYEGQRFATVSAMDVNLRWLEMMKGMPKLEKLRVQGCEHVDDAGAKVLATFPSLKEVDLKGTTVSEKGLALLRTAKPKIQIYSGPWKAPSANFRNN